MVLRVGDEWTHENNNPLYNQLHNERGFRLALIRRGQPVIIDYYVDHSANAETETH